MDDVVDERFAFVVGHCHPMQTSLGAEADELLFRMEHALLATGFRAVCKSKQRFALVLGGQLLH